MNSMKFLESVSADYRRVQLAEIPRTAADVKRIYGKELDCILKTLVFQGTAIVIAVVQGTHRIDINKLALEANDAELQIVPPNRVAELTGVSVGAIGPFDGPAECIRVLDSRIASLEAIVNMGSGTPGTGLEMTTRELVRVWPGKIAPISL